MGWGGFGVSLLHFCCCAETPDRRHRGALRVSLLFQSQAITAEVTGGGAWGSCPIVPAGGTERERMRAACVFLAQLPLSTLT